MANGALKPDDFGGATNVMESGLLRVLTEESTKGTGEMPVLAEEPQPEAEQSEPEIEVVVNAESEATETVDIVPDGPRRGSSRVIVAALSVATVVLAADAVMLTMHHHKAPVPATAAPELPRYMLLPPATAAVQPANEAAPAANEAVPAANEAAANEAAPPADAPSPAPAAAPATRSRHHHHHHHGKAR